MLAQSCCAPQAHIPHDPLGQHLLAYLDTLTDSLQRLPPWDAVPSEREIEDAVVRWLAQTPSSDRHWRQMMLDVALTTASLLMTGGHTATAIRDLLIQAGALDTLAISTDLTRDRSAWAALISTEIRNWYNADSFRDATLETCVWSFRAMALSAYQSGGRQTS